MPVLDRSELEASPLADLHAIADQLSLDGFRRLRKADLIDAILDRTGASGGAGGNGSAGAATAVASSDERERPARRRRLSRSRSARPAAATQERGGEPEVKTGADTRAGAGKEPPSGEDRPADRSAEGVVELLGNGSAFLRVEHPDSSDDDVYISAAQVRRCGLVSGDRVTGPVRTPRRSERYPSLVRVDTINGVSAETVSQGARYEDLAVAYPSERIALDAEDPTLAAIERLAPLGRGSRAVIVGPPRAGKSETLRRLLRAVVDAADADAAPAATGLEPDGAGASDDAVGPSDDGAGASADAVGPSDDAAGASADAVGPSDDGAGASADAAGASDDSAAVAGVGEGSAATASAPALGAPQGFEVTVVLAGVRPEEIAAWREGRERPGRAELPSPVAALDFAASAETQGQAVERALDAAKRVAARGGNALVLIDGLDGLHPPAARKALAAARNLRDGGSLTVIATASRPFGGESTVIALDPALAATGRGPIVDLRGSGTIKPELLVGEDGARAIAQARAAAFEAAG